MAQRDVVRSLIVDIRTRSTKFEQGMGRANRVLSRFGVGARGARFALNALVPALGAVAGAAGLVQLTRRAIDAGDQIQKLSIRLGGSTEALSQYRFVADRSGISFQTMTMGLQRMTRRIAEAAVGTGEARGALQELGLSAQSLATLPLEDQFERVADALSGVGSESDKVRLAMKLFDSEGVSLIQTMEGGAAGIRALRAEADSLGLTMSQDVADQMAAAKDATAGLDAALLGLGNTLAINFADDIAGAVEGLTEFIRLLGMASNAAGVTPRPTGPRTGVFPGGQGGGGGMHIPITGGTVSPPAGQGFEPMSHAPGDMAALADLEAIADREAAHRRMAEMALDFEHQITEASRRESERRRQIAEFEATTVASMRRGLLAESLSLLSALGVKSKQAAIASIALNKALRIAEVIQHTAAGVARANAELPYPLSLTAAAHIKAIGAAQIGIIAATGLVQAGNVGGGGAGAGTAGGPPLETAAAAPVDAGGARGQTTIQFLGDVYGFDDFEGRVVEALQRADGRDVVVISSRGRTATEIRAHG